MGNNRHFKKPSSICWDCTQQECEWISFLEPVPGWKAEERMIKYRNREFPSARVIECPKYKAKECKNVRNRRKVL